MRKGTLQVIIGTQRYAIERPWGKLPQGIAFKTKSKIACDSKGNVYVFQRGDPPVVVFDTNGKYLRSWGNDLFSDAHGIYIDDDDRVFLVDRDSHEIVVCDTKGKVLFTLGKRNRPHDQAPFNHPTDVAVGPKGDIYVSDGYANTCCHRFSPKGKLIRTWGGWGSGPGQFTTPHGIACLADGRVLVGDRENDRVQVFNAEGDYLTEWKGFFHPMDIWVDRQGIIYVSDQIPRLVALRADGSVVGRCRAALIGGHGMRGDRAGNIYTVETRVPEITKMRPIR